jgi:broad specificity phosphatase PhoE
MELWLVRHGESTWNSVRRFQGGLDAPLSSRGREQARALAAGLAAVRFDALYTSPLSRARETAAPCEAVLGLEAVALDDLREVGLGDWEGLTLETVMTRDEDRYQRWLHAPVDHPPPGGEPMVALAERVRRALARLAARHVVGRVLAVSHGGAIASALCGWLGRPLDTIWTVRVDNASITRVGLPGGRVLGVNETGHLAGAPAEAATP